MEEKSQRNTTRRSRAKAAPAKPVVSEPVAAPADVSVVEVAALEEPVKKAKKETKVKVVRDSFTMPQSDYQTLRDLKDICQKGGRAVKKSELLRAGVRALASLSAEELLLAVSKVEAVRTGRPKKH